VRKDDENALETLEGDVLSTSELDEVLLAVDDGESAVLRKREGKSAQSQHHCQTFLADHLPRCSGDRRKRREQRGRGRQRTAFHCPTSPVLNHPSSVHDSAVRSSRLSARFIDKQLDLVSLAPRRNERGEKEKERNAQ
jgi:hypothetical protein